MTTTSADSLRPSTWDDYIGQVALKNYLIIQAEAARNLGRPMRHTLLYGPPGTGKTTLGGLIASLTGDNFLRCIMPLDEDDFRGLRGFSGGVLFLDEIHLGSKRDQTELQPLLEHGHMRPAGRNRLDFERLTVIGATTELTKVIPALRDRFIIPHFDPYTDDELTQIVTNMARAVNVIMSEADFAKLGRASGGKPRQGSLLMYVAEDLQSSAGHPVTADAVLMTIGLTEDGLNQDHVEYIKRLYARDSPMGMQVLKQMLPLDESMILDLERLLLGLDLVERTDKGRMLTNAGMRRAVELGCTR